VDSDSCKRLRLAYSSLDKNSVSDIVITDKDGNYKNRISLKSYESSSYPTYDAYLDQCYNPGTGEAIFIPETGEIILGDSCASEIDRCLDTDVLTVSYDKSEWSTGDIRPEHYFDCTQHVMDSEGNVLEKISFDSHDQAINYDIRSNQQIQINTYASEVFVHAIGRDIEDLVTAMEEANVADNNIAKLGAMLDDPDLEEDERDNINITLDTAKKQRDLIVDKLQRMYEHGLDTFSGYIEDATVTGTRIGSRIERLGLVKNRLMELKTTARDLADENENVELTDIAISTSEAELTYNAALMATGQISQQSLLNYI
jgi:flagellar hook-associated protein 3 FlgL